MLSRCLCGIFLVLTGILCGSLTGSQVKIGDNFYLNQTPDHTFQTWVGGIIGLFLGALAAWLFLSSMKKVQGVFVVALAIPPIIAGALWIFDVQRNASLVAEAAKQDAAVNAAYAKNAAAALDEFERLTGFHGKRDRDGEGEYHLKIAKSEALKQVVALGARDTTNGSLSATWTIKGQLISLGFSEESADTSMVTALVARSAR